MPIADRNRPEFENLIGLFLNLMVLRTDLSNDPPFADLVGRVRQTFVGAYEHADWPYERLIATGDGARYHSPVRVVVNCMTARNERTSLSDATLEHCYVSSQPPSFADASLHLVDHGDRLVGTILYKRDLFSPRYVAGVASAFKHLVRQVSRGAERRLSAYDIRI
jgi:non-ribosomal peptide synthetase component F